MIVKEILENLRETKNSEISAKDFEIQSLKSEMSQSEMKAKEELENLGENLDTFAGKLYSEKHFVDVKIVCNKKHLLVTRKCFFIANNFHIDKIFFGVELSLRFSSSSLAFISD